MEERRLFVMENISKRPLWQRIIAIMLAFILSIGLVRSDIYSAFMQSVFGVDVDTPEQVNADTVFILPNNGNIILAAEQAKSLTKDKEIVVVPTKTVPQGITAVINYVEDRTAEENLKAMQDEIVNVKTGQVTYAVRNTTMDGVEVKENDIMGLDGKNILAVGSDISDVTAELVDKLIDEDSELVSIYYGEDISEEDANKLADVVSSKHKDVDVEVNFGGQPVYYYLISVE